MDLESLVLWNRSEDHLYHIRCTIGPQWWLGDEGPTSSDLLAPGSGPSVSDGIDATAHCSASLPSSGPLALHDTHPSSIVAVPWARRLWSRLSSGAHCGGASMHVARQHSEHSGATTSVTHELPSKTFRPPPSTFVRNQPKREIPYDISEDSSSGCYVREMPELPTSMPRPAVVSRCLSTTWASARIHTPLDHGGYSAAMAPPGSFSDKFRRRESKVNCAEYSF